MRKPDFLILDEATSALDTQTSDIVVRNLMKIFQNKVILFITHDKNITALVDEIWQIRSGKLEIVNKKNDNFIINDC